MRNRVVILAVMAMCAVAGLSTSSTALAEESGTAVITCDYSPVGSSGPPVKPAPGNECRAPAKNAAAILKVDQSMTVRMCLEHANQPDVYFSCSTQEVVAGQPAYFALPAEPGSYNVLFMTWGLPWDQAGKAITKSSYRVLGQPKPKVPKQSLTIACQYSPPGSSGPSIKQAKGNKCVGSSHLNPVAVLRLQGSQTIRMCVSRASDQEKYLWCKTQVITAGQPAYFRLPTKQGSYDLSFLRWDESTQPTGQLVEEATFKVIKK